MTKCIKCGEEATVRLTPDLDIVGIVAREEHRQEIYNDFMFSYMDGNIKRFNKKYNIKNNKNAGSRKVTKERRT